MIASVEKTGPILTLTATTALTGHQIADAMNSIYPDFDFKHALWDMHAGGLDAFHADLFPYVGLTSRRRAVARGPAARTGILVQRRFEVLAASAYAHQAERFSPVRFWASTDRSALMRWLTTGERPHDEP